MPVCVFFHFVNLLSKTSAPCGSGGAVPEEGAGAAGEGARNGISIASALHKQRSLIRGLPGLSEMLSDL